MAGLPDTGPSSCPGSTTCLAIDACTDAGVTVDFDGETRPANFGFDIGFDELRVDYLYLPLILR